MIKSINSIFITISTTIICACSWNVNSKAQDVVISSEGICEYKLGQGADSVRNKFEKIIVYNEEGETFKYRGKICNNSILSDFEFNKGLISKISVIDKGFCKQNICIGSSFEEVKSNLPDSRLFFGGEDGGVFFLEDKNGVSYIFSTEGIDISCYVNQDKCKGQIGKAKLIALVI